MHLCDLLFRGRPEADLRMILRRAGGESYGGAGNTQPEEPLIWTAEHRSANRTPAGRNLKVHASELRVRSLAKACLRGFRAAIFPWFKSI